MFHPKPNWGQFTTGQRLGRSRRCFLKIVGPSAFVLMLLSACTTEQSESGCASDLRTEADTIVALLRDADFAALSRHVHEERGLSFSPYARGLSDLFLVNFSRAELAQLQLNDKTYRWGRYDGSGLEISLTPAQYFHEFIYDMDYLKYAERICLKSRQLKQSREYAGVAAAFPDCTMVIYRYQGKKDIGFKDSRELILIFAGTTRQWSLVGLAHSEDTL